MPKQSVLQLCKIIWRRDSIQNKTNQACLCWFINVMFMVKYTFWCTVGRCIVVDAMEGGILNSELSLCVVQQTIKAVFIQQCFNNAFFYFITHEPLKQKKTFFILFILFSSAFTVPWILIILKYDHYMFNPLSIVIDFHGFMMNRSVHQAFRFRWVVKTRASDTLHCLVSSWQHAKM